jgi:hypothetical protein
MKATDFVRAQARRVCTLLTIAVLLPAWVQAAQMTVGEAIHHDTSPPLSEMVDKMPLASPGENRAVPIGVRPDFAPDPAAAAPDGGLEITSAPSLGPTPAPSLSVSGLSEQDNINTVGFAVVPPDTNGDIGLDDSGARIYIQYINSVWGVFDDTGSLTAGPFAGNSFWQGFGGFCQSNNDGDPVVLYDDQAGQWFFSQFSVNQGIQCVAISTTSDPLGPYHRYAFTVTPGGANDYPKLGVWDDGTTGSSGQSAYTFTMRDFGGAGGAFSVSAGVMERDAMLIGAPAQFIKFINPCVAGDCIEGQLPPHLAGPPPPAGTCPTFWTAVDSAYDDDPAGVDGYRNHTLCVDWANLGNSTYAEGPIVPAGSNFDRFLGNGFSDCISPVSGGEVLDCLAAFTMFRAQYRWFGSYASLVLNTTVDAGAERAGIRWAETRSNDGDSNWFLQQDGTYAPGASAERWMGSIAQDQDGNIALGYSITNGSNFPSVAYTSRMASDPPGTMPGGEVLCHLGTGAQQASSNRWGDYSSMSIDPTDDCTFWYTQEYYQTTGSFNFNTRICSFTFADCGDEPECTVDADCDDTAFCNGAETCNAGTCQPGTPVDCDDGLFCNGEEVCDEVDDSCVPGPAPCPDDCNEDDDICTGCGDGVCDLGEDCDSCPSDCISGTLPGAVCGNGICEAGDGEDCLSCPSDCNGKQNGKPSNRFCCGDGDGQNPVPCSDSLCSTGSFMCTDDPSTGGEYCCGDAICDDPPEDGFSCELDCGAPPVCIPTHEREKGPRCSDGLDNDCDGLIDGDDPDC